MESALPTHLYKFRSLTGGQRSFTRDIMLNRCLYWSAPAQFNDPFDCAPVLHLTEDRSVKESYIRALFQKYAKNLSKIVQEQMIESALSAPHSGYNETLNLCRKKMREDIGICSLTLKSDHTLMWTHYADAHQGLCLRFKIFEDDPQFGLAFPVTYSSSRPIIEVATKNIEDLVRQVLLTKADCWSYEQEWRMFDVEEGPGLHPLREGVLDGIIFGAAAKSLDIEEVKGWASSLGSPVELFQARLDDREFRLTIDPL